MTPREAILLEIVRRIAELSDWHAVLLPPGQPVETNAPRLATVWLDRDEVVSLWTEHEQERVLSVLVRFAMPAELAVSDTGSNPLRALDAAAEEIEQALFGEPGLEVEDVDISDVSRPTFVPDEPSDSTVTSGQLRFTVGYRHTRRAS